MKYCFHNGTVMWPPRFDQSSENKQNLCWTSSSPSRKAKRYKHFNLSRRLFDIQNVWFFFTSSHQSLLNRFNISVNNSDSQNETPAKDCGTLQDRICCGELSSNESLEELRRSCKHFLTFWRFLHKSVCSLFPTVSEMQILHKLKRIFK